MRIIWNVFNIALATIQLWWKKLVALTNYIGVIKLPSDLGEIFGGFSVSAPTLILVGIGLVGLYLANRDFWHGAYAHVSGQSSTHHTRSKIWADKIRHWFERVSAGSLPKKISQVSLSEGLYVGEMSMSIDTLKTDRYSEISIRVFNGTGRNITIYGLGGNLKFRPSPDTDVKHRGTLPQPSITSNTARTAFPYREWIICLHQRVPADQADNMLRLIDENKTLHIVLDQLELTVRDERGQTPAERLKLWDGMTIQQGINVGRITFLQAHSGFGIETRGS
jgi:hypothetical protein